MGDIVLATLRRIGDNRQTIKVRLDQFEGILRRISVQRDHQGERLTHVSNAIPRYRRLEAFAQGLTRREAHGNSPQRLEILRCENAENLRQRFCPLGPDFTDLCVRFLTSKNRRMNHIRQMNIGNEFPGAF